MYERFGDVFIKKFVETDLTKVCCPPDLAKQYCQKLQGNDIKAFRSFYQSLIEKLRPLGNGSLVFRQQHSFISNMFASRRLLSCLNRVQGSCAINVYRATICEIGRCILRQYLYQFWLPWWSSLFIMFRGDAGEFVPQQFLLRNKKGYLLFSLIFLPKSQLFFYLGLKFCKVLPVNQQLGRIGGKRVLCRLCFS